MRHVYFYRASENHKTLLLHYKAIPKNLHKLDNKHTNSWEISEVLRLFMAIGWNIELVDRRCTNWVPSRSYDLFISNASGSQGDRFLKMAKQIPDVKTIMYAAGPAVDISDQLVDERYENFRFRHNVIEATKHLRTFRTNLDDIMHFVDEIICIDDNGFSSSTYARFNKPIHKLRPSSSHDSFDGRLERFRKKRSNFVLFLGNGFIAKGADVVLDAFMRYPNLRLEICGPYKHDKFFWNFYKKRIVNMPNVSVHGFIRVGSKKYFDIVSRAAWQIHNSAAEGCATSVTTLIQGGVLPISNFETGVDVSGFGIGISNSNRDFVESTAKAIETAVSIDEVTFQASLRAMYFSAERFTQSAYRQNLGTIIQNLI